MAGSEPLALLEAPAQGRVFGWTGRAGLADTTPGGRARLDAIVRWLQDAALADVRDAGLADTGAWVVRKGRLVVPRFPRFGEALTLETFCSGFGARWAERRTELRGGDGAHASAVFLWVFVDRESGLPLPLGERYHEVYGEAAAGRTVRAGLRHPRRPPEDAEARTWTFRAADLDVAGHVNNAVYWEALEEELGDRELDGLDAEVEHRAAGFAGPASVVAAEGRRWVVGPTGEVLASLALSPTPPPPSPR